MTQKIPISFSKETLAKECINNFINFADSHVQKIMLSKNSDDKYFQIMPLQSLQLCDSYF